MKKSTVFVALLGLIFGLSGTVKAGTIPPVPIPMPTVPVGGGGGSPIISDISTNSSWGLDWANGSVSGPLVTQQISSGIWTNANPNPEPGNIGTFNMNVSASGMFYHPGDPIPSAQLPQVGAFLRTNNVHSEPWGDGGTTYLFDPTLELSSRGNGGFWIDPDGNYSGWLAGNFGVVGGTFTNVDVNFQENHWTGKGPRPEWLTDWSAYFNASGIITATNFTVVPEPATLALFAISGVAAILKGKRGKKSRVLCPTA